MNEAQAERLRLRVDCNKPMRHRVLAIALGQYNLLDPCVNWATSMKGAGLQVTFWSQVVP